jgi:putative ABC transport system ATP-binding protein
VIPETEPLAEFCGEAIALPVFQGGTLLTILLFMFMQNPWLGVASIALIPLQLYIIPKLQRRVNSLKKERVRRVRVLSQRLGESVSGIREIRAQGTRRYQLAEFSFRLGELFRIRLDIFRTKFLMKFLNNTIGQMTPFLFYAIGGYLVIRGDLTLGALVAALAAYKDILGPWKELLNHYQRQQDAAVKYEQIIEQFQPPDLLPERPFLSRLSEADRGLQLRLDRITCVDEQGERLFGGLSLELAPGTSTRIVIDHTGRRTALAQVMSGLRPADSGQVTLDGHPLGELSERDIHSRLAYVGPEPFLFNRAITYNLGYALNHRPPVLEERSEEERAQLIEAEAAGNSTDWFDETFGTIWTDFTLLGVDSWPDAVPQMMQVLHVVGVVETVADRSKLEKFDAVEWEEKLNREGFAAELLHARKLTRERIEKRGLSHLVSGFDRSLINPWSTYAENILFGVTTLSGFTTRMMAESEALRGGLRHGGLYDSAVAVGSAAVRALLMLHHNLPSDHELVVRFSLDDPDWIDEMGRAVDLLAGEPLPEQREQAEILMISVFLNIVPGTFNLVVIPDDIEEKVLATRELSLAYTRQMSFENFREFDQAVYNPGLSVFDNFIFGRINHRETDAYDRLREIVDEVVLEVELFEVLMILFFANSQSGIGGSRLPEGARHRIALARTLFKRPDIIVLHDALPRYSKQDRQLVIERIREYLPQSAIVSLTDSASADEGFADRYVLDDSGLRVELQSGPVIGKAPVTSDQSLLSLLDGIAELAALTDAQKTMLAMESQTIRATAGEVIYAVGDEANHAYVLLQGRAELHRSGANDRIVVSPVLLRILIGDLEVLAGMPRASALHAVDDCELVRLDAGMLGEVLQQNPQLAQDFLQRVASVAAGRDS